MAWFASGCQIVNASCGVLACTMTIGARSEALGQARGRSPVQ